MDFSSDETDEEFCLQNISLKRSNCKNCKSSLSNLSSSNSNFSLKNAKSILKIHRLRVKKSSSGNELDRTSSNDSINEDQNNNNPIDLRSHDKNNFLRSTLNLVKICHDRLWDSLF
jgi:hypothetical protein